MDWLTDNFECLFSVSVVNSHLVGQPRERSETDFYRIKTGMTWKLRVNWRLDDDSAEMDVAKVLFENSKEYVVKRLEQGLSLEKERIYFSSILTSNLYFTAEEADNQKNYLLLCGI